MKIEKDFELQLETTEEKDAKSIVELLRDKGFEAYFAGGYVRDKVFGVYPHDIDIATNATPEEVEKFFKKTIAVGKAFGVERVILGKDRVYEVATFRTEGPYTDKRRPDWVKFTSAEKDAERRDFTINALFYDPIEQKIIDYVGGLDDLDNRILRFVGEAQERVSEDYLRIVRAIRFKNKYELKMDAAAEAAIKYNADSIKDVSKERIQAELNKMLLDKRRAEAIVDLDNFGLLEKILPESEAMKGAEQTPKFHAEGNVWQHTIMALSVLPAEAPLEVALAVLFHDVGKPQTSVKAPDRIRFSGHEKVGAEIALEILKRLKYANDITEKVVWLVRNHMFFINFADMKESTKRRLMQYPASANPERKESWFPEMIMMQEADVYGAIPLQDTALKLIKKEWKKELSRPKEEKVVAIIDGKTIMKELKIKAGPQVGRLKDLAQDAFLEGRVKTKKEAVELLKKVSREKI